MASFVSGAAFGAAMLAAGFHQTSVIIDQLKLENWHMLQAFLTATASSAVVYAVAERSGFLKLRPRSTSPLGLFAKYDGNVVGGGLLGVGMALSGACPGTLLTQVAVGVPAGVHALNGAVLGGIVWTGLVSGAVKRRKEAVGAKTEAVTVGDWLGASRATTLVIVEAVLLAVVAGTTRYTPRATETKLLGAVGGLLIGLAQLVSLVARRSMMGISGSYEEIGNSFWWLVRGADPASKPRSHQNVLFGSGLVAGAWGLSQLLPSLLAGPVAEVSPLLASAGGALMIVGSRMAGGCTSGHGISGISLLSASSVVTFASAFAAGMLVAPLVH